MVVLRSEQLVPQSGEQLEPCRYRDNISLPWSVMPAAGRRISLIYPKPPYTFIIESSLLSLHHYYHL